MSENQPLTIFVKLKIKEGLEEEFVETVKECRKAVLTEKGCLAYRFFKVRKQPRAYMIFEQYRDKEALAAHLKHLQELLGPLPPEGGALPAKLVNFQESDEMMFCSEID